MVQGWTLHHIVRSFLYLVSCQEEEVEKRVWGSHKTIGPTAGGSTHRLRPFNHLALWPKFISALRRLLLLLLLFNTNPNAIVVVAINKTSYTQYTQRGWGWLGVCVWGALYINLDNKQLGYLFFLILTSTFSAHVARTVEPEAPHRQRDRRTDTDVDKVIYTQTTLTHIHTHSKHTRGICCHLTGDARCATKSHQQRKNL